MGFFSFLFFIFVTFLFLVLSLIVTTVPGTVLYQDLRKKKLYKEKNFLFTYHFFRDII